jgi:DNA-binding beta-propeller fold protein YncE
MITRIGTVKTNTNDYRAYIEFFETPIIPSTMTSKLKQTLFIILFGLPMISGWSQENIAHTGIEDKAIAAITCEGYPDWVEIDGKSVWISNEGLNLMQRIDPRVNKIVAAVKVNKPCAAFTIGYGSIWVASCGDNAIVRISLVSNSVLASIALPIADSEGSIVAAEGGVWVLSDKNGRLSRIDPLTNKVSPVIEVAPNSFAAAAGYGSIWITNTGDNPNANGSIQRIDPKLNKVIARIEVGKQPRFLAVGEGGVWTLNQTDGSVTRIDPQTNKVVATILCDVPGTGGDIACGEGYVWVRAKKDMLLVIDPKENRVVEIFGPPAGSGAVRAGYGAVWVTAHDINKIWRIDPTAIERKK